ncbi:hypothetical protein [Pseudofrankia asymbiotica]|uniref:hypothetical protein n=1 Tax=Pseudofrankia asymbiotica TaxID=1834516 RepID=UPI001054D922|nr:hypothetical protein [Pseudofrankia asymbiotica]
MADSEPDAVAPCSLLTATEVSLEAGSTFLQGSESPSEGDHRTLQCPYQSPKGWTYVWTARGAGGTSVGWQEPPRCPDGELENADGPGYRAYTCTTGTNIQYMRVRKGDNYLRVDVGAGAPPAAGRRLGALAAARLP